MASLNSVAPLADFLVAFKTCRSRAPEQTLQSSKSSLHEPEHSSQHHGAIPGSCQRQGSAVTPHLPRGRKLWVHDRKKPSKIIDEGT